MSICSFAHWSVRISFFLSSVILLAACASSGDLLKEIDRVGGFAKGGDGGIEVSEIASGLKEALKVGSRQVVRQLGREDGFNGDPTIRIPLPSALDRTRKIAAKVGLSDSFDSLELRLNRAAELATPRAQQLFLVAIQQMTLDDAKNILQGPDDAATSYFRQSMGSTLISEMEPIVESSLSEVGAVRVFNDFMDRYNRIPLAPEVDADLTDHVVGLAMDGIFHYLAVEEKAIRENPVKRTTELLQRVFGSLR
ncbi:hypothetical protein AB833_30445 [Chromatiales bacterium (ex Bugula neritina AB1)]|nr:hypothetical protein AB833_30445 [Chromatiales bacterium (ex Bugula neritina AB1)]